MKKFFLAFSFVFIRMTSIWAAAVNPTQIEHIMSEVRSVDIKNSARNLVTWKVGDFQQIKLESAYGDGQIHKEATQEEPAQNAIWLQTDVDFLGGKQQSQSLISRVDGTILRLIINGKEQHLGSGGDGTLRIIEELKTSITVGAGTFDCDYVKAEFIEQGQRPQQFEVWSNPARVNLDGMLKFVMQTEAGPMTMSLLDFGPFRHHDFKPFISRQIPSHN